MADVAAVDSAYTVQINAILIVTLLSFIWHAFEFYDWLSNLLRPKDSFGSADRGALTRTADQTSKVLPIVRHLQRLHDKTNSDGSPCWYVRPDLYTRVESIASDVQRIKYLSLNSDHRRSSTGTAYIADCETD